MEKGKYQCPICNKVVRDLKAHTARMHPDQAPPPDDGDDDGNNLDIKDIGGSDTGYHCTGCGQSLTKGQNPCPNCGEELRWDLVEND